MVELNAIYPPACATTLIVSLDLLSAPQSVTTIIVNVVIPVGAHQVADAIFTEMYEDNPADMGARS